jgi:hypothetical protein
MLQQNEAPSHSAKKCSNKLMLNKLCSNKVDVAYIYSGAKLFFW